MDHLISTPYGKILGRIENGTINLYDTTSLTLLARVKGNSRTTMLTAIRRVVTLTRLSLDLGKMEMELFSGFPSPVFQDRKPRAKKVKSAATEAPVEVKVEKNPSAIAQVVQKLAAKTSASKSKRDATPVETSAA